MILFEKELRTIPKGFKTAVSNVGIRDNTEDFVCIYSDVIANISGVFTQSRFAGPSINICKENIANGEGQAIIAISKNANVANGEKGKKDAETIVKKCAEKLEIDKDNVFIASTGVIGRLYPMDRIEKFINILPLEINKPDFISAARGIMTTDTVPKIFSIKVGEASLVAIAKGVGMMEPNMATLLTFFMTDADISKKDLDTIFKRVMNKTFNCLSIDTDTSTSDTALIMANGLAGKVDNSSFEKALYQVAEYLVKEIAKDGEGATKLIEVQVVNSSSEKQAKRVAKAIVNSPLVKTAVSGSDPNWGRVAMAIGKCDEQVDIVPENTIIKFCGFEVYPKTLNCEDLDKLSELLTHDEVKITVSLGTGNYKSTVWGCDLSHGYIDINTEYST